MLKRRSTECEGGPRARCRRVDDGGDTARPRRDAGRARPGVGWAPGGSASGHEREVTFSFRIWIWI